MTLPAGSRYQYNYRRYVETKYKESKTWKGLYES